MVGRSRSLYPIRDKDVRIPLSTRIPIGREYQVSTIGREHRKPVKGLVERDSLKIGTILANHEQIKVPTIRIVPIGAEDDPLSIWMPEWRKACPAQLGNLT